MATVSNPTIKKRTWTSANGVKKSTYELTFRVIDGSEKKRHRRSGYATREAAEAGFRDIQREVYEGKFVPPSEKKAEAKAAPRIPTLKEFIDDFHAEGSAGKRQRSKDQDRLATKWFREYLKDDKRPLNRITPRDIDGFISHRIAAKRAEATVVRELATLRRMFNVARRWGIPLHNGQNPCEDADAPDIPEGDVVYLEPEEIHRLLDACDKTAGPPDSGSPDEADGRDRSREAPYLRPLLALAYLTGLRRAELFNLRWEHVDLRPGQESITVKNTVFFRTKSKKNRRVPLNAEAIAELDRWKRWFEDEIERAEERASVSSGLTPQLRSKARERLEVLRRCEPKPHRLVFPSFRNVDKAGQAAPLDNVKKALARATKDAGLAARFSGLHCLRHTFAVSLVRAGVSLPVVQKLLGHSKIDTTMIYLRFNDDEGMDSTRLLPSIRPAVQQREEGNRQAAG